MTPYYTPNFAPTWLNTSAEMQQNETNYLCDVILREIHRYEDMSLNSFVFMTGRSPAAIRHIIDVELPKRGHSFVYKSQLVMCEPDLDEEIQIPNQDIHIWVYPAS